VSFENERIIISAHRFLLLQRYDFMAITQKTPRKAKLAIWRSRMAGGWLFLAVGPFFFYRIILSIS
jgi:hypothetical protein